MFSYYFLLFFFFLMIRLPPRSTQLRTVFPYTTLFRSLPARAAAALQGRLPRATGGPERSEEHTSELQSPSVISYAVFCLKKKKKINTSTLPSIKLMKYTNKIIKSIL